MAQSENGSFVRFMQLPQEIRDMIWSEAWASRKPEVCTHFYTRSPINGRPSFPPKQLTVDVDVALMHTCRDSRAFLTSKAGGVRFRYSLAAKRNVPCRAFDPSLDTLYLGSYNWGEATLKTGYPEYGPSLLSLADNELTDSLRQVKTIAMEPDLWSCFSGFQNHRDKFYDRFLAIFPKFQKLSVVVNPFLPLEDAHPRELIVCTPRRRCRLVEAAGDPSFLQALSSEHWLYAFRMLLYRLPRPTWALPLQIQAFEVYIRRQGRMQWKKYPL